MKNLELLPLTAEVKKRLEEFAKQYRRYGHIVIEIVSYSEGRLIVRAEQKDLVNDKFLSKKELTERVREMFKGEIPEDWKLTVSAVNFDRKDIDKRRIGVCGGSGGGTLSVFLTLLDERYTAAAPAMSFTSHFDGGCPCESGMGTVSYTHLTLPTNSRV